jgi:hypothetical protein
VTHDEELGNRETARRKSLWELVAILPGDHKALDVLDGLDDIELRERHDLASFAQALGVEQLRDAIPTESHPIGCRIVREANIPQPWRERFLRASLGSTRVLDGPFVHDWENFLSSWELEMAHLQNHRAARAVSKPNR